jgi:hypothetical protein
MDPLVLFAMVLVFGASSAVFWLSTKRWTTQRQWVALADWAAAGGFQVRRGDEARLPVVLGETSAVVPRACVEVASSEVTFVQIETAGLDERGGTTGTTPVRWNLMVRSVNAEWAATALRPTRAERSVTDLFSLSSYPTMATSERFVLYGADSEGASRLSRTHARGLMPPDVGLLVIGSSLILDFSARPFDGIEFGRMMALGEQIAGELKK